MKNQPITKVPGYDVEIITKRNWRRLGRKMFRMRIVSQSNGKIIHNTQYYYNFGELIEAQKIIRDVLTELPL